MHHVGGRAPYGVENWKPGVDDERADYVRRIFALFLATGSDTIGELAEHEGIASSYMTRVLRLNLKAAGSDPAPQPE